MASFTVSFFIVVLKNGRPASYLSRLIEGRPLVAVVNTLYTIE
jgi:hypothetical protein